MPYCRACGIEVETNTKYCPDCGEELNFGSTEPIEKTPEPEEIETTVGETDPVNPEPDPAVTHETESEPDVEAESEPEPFIEADTEPSAKSEPTVKAEPEEESSPSVSIWAKIGVVIAIPISLAGIFLEVASVYTLFIGGYTLGQFILMSIIFGLVAFLPIAYMYSVYRRSTWSVKGVFA